MYHWMTLILQVCSGPEHPQPHVTALWLRWEPYLVVHLLGAVKHIHHDAQGSPQIFRSLRLASARRARRCSAHGQVQRLGQGDVTPFTANDKGKKERD